MNTKKTWAIEEFLEKIIDQYDDMILQEINGNANGDLVLQLLDKRELYVTRLNKLDPESSMQQAADVMDELLTKHGHLFAGQAKPAASRPPRKKKPEETKPQDPPQPPEE